MELGEILSLVGTRYREHMEGCKTFPHEIGLLLGYPAEDVKGFIENQGRRSLYSGYWKVYSNLEECQRICASYDHAREKVIHLMAKGMTVRTIMEMHHLYGYCPAAGAF